MEAGVFSVGNPANLTSLDVACGMPLGWNSSPPPRPHRCSLDEFASLLFSSSFGRGPCYMPFSGGSESSTWLAVATRYARSHGHDDPIPITLHYPGLASPEQLGLQEHVIAQLGLADWGRIEPEEDLDLVGPIAGAAMRQAGPLWPPHAYVMAPLLEAARDGVFLLLTALEDFFTWWRWAPLVSVVARHRRPTARDAALLSTMLMPVALRVRAARRQGTPPPMPWLRPAAEKRALALLRTRQATVPLRCNHAMTAQSTHRCFTGAAGTFRALGEALGTTMTASVPTRRCRVIRRRLWVARIRRPARNSAAAGRRSSTGGLTRRAAAQMRSACSSARGAESSRRAGAGEASMNRSLTLTRCARTGSATARIPVPHVFFSTHG